MVARFDTFHMGSLLDAGKEPNASSVIKWRFLDRNGRLTPLPKVTQVVQTSSVATGFCIIVDQSLRRESTAVGARAEA